MSNKCAQAISVANHYFILADDMIPGFENYFADDVVLIWFGRKITGKTNVANFILSNKARSFHSFSNIMPISGITCEDKQPNKKAEQSSDQGNDSPEVKYKTHTCNCSGEALAGYLHEAEMSTTCEDAIDSNRKQESDGKNILLEKNYDADYDTDNTDIEKYMSEVNFSDTYYDCANADADTNQDQVSANAIAETNDQGYDLNEYDLRNLFEPEITPQAFVENVLIHNINRVKLEEEMISTIRAINRECSQGDGSEADTTKKYLETKGAITFVKKYVSEDSFSCYHWSRISRQRVWTRKCKLQIAYSLPIDDELPIIAKKTTKRSYVTQEKAYSACESNLYIVARHNAPNTQENNRLPSLEEIIQIATQSIPDKNYFNGYLRPINFAEDRENFLKSFEAEVKEKAPNLHSSVQYVRNKLVFNFSHKKSFDAMYRIHMIVYK